MSGKQSSTFERYGVLVDPDHGSLEEAGADLLYEAGRVVGEAEARLPRVELALGDRATAGGESVKKLREALSELRNHIGQPGEGDEWTFDEFEAAKASLGTAEQEERRFLRKARRWRS